MKRIVTNGITDENIISPQQLFKVIITEEPNKIVYEFSPVVETDELNELFKKT